MVQISRIGLVLLGLAISAKAETPFSSLLYTSGNFTDDQLSSSDFATCTTDGALSDFGNPVTDQQLETIPVDSRWFGGSTVNASSFAVQDCSMLKQQLGRAVNIYSGPVTSSCQVTWYLSDSYLTVVVNLTGDATSWTVSLPTVPGAITRSTCLGTRAQCLLASVIPCTNINLGGGGLSSFVSGAKETCPVGQYSPDYLDDKDLIYGLKATFYPNAYDCSANTTEYQVPDLTTLAADKQYDRCQDALDYTVPNSTFWSSPALPADEFSSCYAAKLEGYVEVKNNTDIVFLTPQPVPKYYNSYRVCLRYSNLVKLTLDNKVLIQSNTGTFDAVLTCIDLPYLRQGFLPFSLEYAAPPMATESVILQFYLIPVAQVISDFRPGYQYQPTYACDACALFATGITGDNCCPALDTCAFRAADCKDEEAVPPLPTLSPPPLAPSPLPELESPPPAPVTEAPPTPPVSQEPPSPVPESPASPPVTEAPPSPPVTETPPSPPVTETPPSPPVTGTPPSPPVTETPPSPPVTGTPPTPPVTETPPSPPYTGMPPSPNPVPTPLPVLPAPPKATAPSPLVSVAPSPNDQPYYGVPPSPLPLPFPTIEPFPPQGSEGPAASPGGSETPMCPCDQTCADQVVKRAEGGATDVSFATFKDLVATANTWDELDALLQE
jgi:hypothetical protein